MSLKKAQNTVSTLEDGLNSGLEQREKALSNNSSMGKHRQSCCLFDIEGAYASSKLLIY